MANLVSNVYPTLAPNQLLPGGTGGTAGCFKVGSNILYGQFIASVSQVSISLVFWDEDLQTWFTFPIDPIVADPGVNNGKIVQRWVVGKSPNGIWCTFYVTGTGTAVNSVRLVDGAGA